MAINPNTNFTAGQVLTADQANRWPRGVMALDEPTANILFGAETVTATTATFTAVANRYYKITYFEPKMPYVQAGNSTVMRIRLTNVTGTVLQVSTVINQDGGANAFGPTLCTTVVTFSAGNTVIVGTLTSPGLAVTAERAATSPALLLVEDIGPA
jgi:hypothetical protein